MIFHLAIPSVDLEASKAFYVGIGAKLGRVHPDHIILKIFNCQLVCHLSGTKPRLAMYPRHFGVILPTHNEYFSMYDKYQSAPFVFEHDFLRGQGTPHEHHTFFLKDPSNNLIEFKWYRNSEAVFG